MKVAFVDIEDGFQILFNEVGSVGDGHDNLAVTIIFSRDLFEKYGVKTKEELPRHLWYAKLENAFASLSACIDTGGLAKEHSS